jgi:8-oxo-dGTP pyrophosphatase MutT (NUDIX family)
MSESDTKSKDLYFVAVKLFLRDGGKLLITHDIFGSWDLPGGRIKKDEFEAPLESVIERKMSEELGTDVRYELGKQKVFFRVERLEHNTQEMVRIFGIGYAAIYLGGEVRMGEHHDQMEWVDVNTFKPEDYFTGGWLAGVQEYLEKTRT